MNCRFVLSVAAPVDCDASGPIIEWIVTQYKEIMERDFGKTNDKNKRK